MCVCVSGGGGGGEGEIRESIYSLIFYAYSRQ